MSYFEICPVANPSMTFNVDDILNSCFFSFIDGDCLTSSTSSAICYWTSSMIIVTQCSKHRNNSRKSSHTIPSKPIHRSRMDQENLHCGLNLLALRYQGNHQLYEHGFILSLSRWITDLKQFGLLMQLPLDDFCRKYPVFGKMTYPTKIFASFSGFGCENSLAC